MRKSTSVSSLCVHPRSINSSVSYKASSEKRKLVTDFIGPLVVHVLIFITVHCCIVVLWRSCVWLGVCTTSWDVGVLQWWQVWGYFDFFSYISYFASGTFLTRIVQRVPPKASSLMVLVVVSLYSKGETKEREEKLICCCLFGNPAGLCDSDPNPPPGLKLYGAVKFW